MKRLTLAFSFLFLSCFLLAQSPTWQWAESSQGSGSDNANAVTTDPSGNVIVAGFFYSPTVSFGTFTLTNTGNYDLFVVKYDASGNVLWARSGGGTYDEVGCGITCDASGNIYVTGYFYSPVMTAAGFSLTNSGAGDCFVIKYNPNGVEQWLTKIGDSGDENGLAIACDISGNVNVTGFFQSPQLAAGSYSLTNAGSRDVFVISLNSAGLVVNALSFGDSGNEAGEGITSDSAGNIYVSGYFFSPTLTVGVTTLSSAGSSDGFTAAFDNAGNPVWATNSGGAYNDASYAITCDAAGNIYTTGAYLSPVFATGSFTFANAGANDLFVTKYTPAGNIVWTKACGGGQDDIGYGITCDAAGNVYVTGHFHSPSIAIGSTTLSNAGVGDMYVFKCDPLGNFLLVESAGGFTDDGGSAVACDPAGNLYVTGYFFSNSVSFSAIVLTNTGSDDMFLAKIPAAPAFSPETDGSRELAFYPNPTSDHFYINTNIRKIINSLGLEVSYKAEDVGGKTKVSFPAHTPAGIYTIIGEQLFSQEKLS